MTRNEFKEQADLIRDHADMKMERAKEIMAEARDAMHRSDHFQFVYNFAQKDTDYERFEKVEDAYYEVRK